MLLVAFSVDSFGIAQGNVGALWGYVGFQVEIHINLSEVLFVHGGWSQ